MYFFFLSLLTKKRKRVSQRNIYKPSHTSVLSFLSITQNPASVQTYNLLLLLLASAWSITWAHYLNFVVNTSFFFLHTPPPHNSMKLILLWGARSWGKMQKPKSNHPSTKNKKGAALRGTCVCVCICGYFTLIQMISHPIPPPLLSPRPPFSTTQSECRGGEREFKPRNVHIIIPKEKKDKTLYRV
ncbi:hypothetical protein COCSADRAFT_338541 [Bipolaris sorokiniana ND90Pr]|uniref:Uncharacterized protein n=1 Tax=Cochliobolus sativus (strain ND90Pr / ATCC 201652) TaxID=665912 RepID=M2R8B9_COCSN|nr:uncharacterized protein COCSADRAFT_338541 [Bipolaris sorokiniana ND90Pr]EMD63184.1 hypothetical protein COCSADRAFT_338541 [Bipolaris sorokiniana ND90Pr]